MTSPDDFLDDHGGVVLFLIFLFKLELVRIHKMLTDEYQLHRLVFL